VSELAPRARLYLIATYAAGIAASGFLARAPAGSVGASTCLAALVLAILGAITQVFVVMRRGGNHSDHLTPAALFAAFLLLPRPLLAPVIVLTFIPEWIWYRRKWYIQLFNISTWIVAVALGGFAQSVPLGSLAIESGTATPAPNIILALAVVFLSQTFSLAVVLQLARGQSLSDSGLFIPRKIFNEVALYCSGWALAAAWKVDPIYGIAALVPLGLIFQALHVPNLRDEAMTDPKTGLANMRHFNFVLQRDLERAERTRQPVALLMCDLDYLRNINNTYGHQVGDLVLAGIANVIRQNIRGCDLAGRFGGEEFCILLADADSLGAKDVAERLRREVEQAAFAAGAHGPMVKATVSIGVAVFPVDGRTADGLMREADLAVYQAKRQGRNRVVIASRESRELAAEWARENLVPYTGPAPAVTKQQQQPLRRFVDDATRLSYTHDGDASPAPRPAHQPPSGAARTGSSGRPLDLFLFIGFLAALAAVACAAGLLAHPAELQQIPFAEIGFFCALTILAEHLAVEIGIEHRGRTSVSVVPIVAISFLAHDVAVVASALAFATYLKYKNRPQPIVKWLFNFAVLILSADSAYWVFRFISGGNLASRSFLELLPPAVIAGLVYYSVNHLCLCIVRGLSERRPPLEIWRDQYQWLTPHYAVFGALALVLTLSYQAFGWAGVLALMAPLGMMRLSIKQFMDRTTVYMNELRSLNQRVGDSYEATLQALTRALDTRDEETEEHSQRVRRYTELIARHYGLGEDEIEDISRGALLHDIGKIGVPDAILLKPSRLTPEEHALMRNHPRIGYSMIADIPFLAKAAELVLHHHEAYDGSGYPSGLIGERIPLGARIFAVADTLDAMTSDRPYRKALSLDAAFAEIRRCREQQFDPAVVDTLLSIPVEEIQSCREARPESGRPREQMFSVSA
jgi:diguanylate cyclase (GGDEF)-like protein